MSRKYWRNLILINQQNPLMVVRSLEIEKDPFKPCEEGEEILGPHVPYLRIVGAPTYLANSTRPDIVFAINLMARHSAALYQTSLGRS
jgi:hypothetical protein